MRRLENKKQRWTQTGVVESEGKWSTAEGRKVKRVEASQRRDVAAITGGSTLPNIQTKVMLQLVCVVRT